MSDLLPQHASKDPQATKGEWENLNVADGDEDDDELSMTLLERRKRLHVLASEINKWEDESVKK